MSGLPIGGSYADQSLYLCVGLYRTLVVKKRKMAPSISDPFERIYFGNLSACYTTVFPN